MVTCLWGRLQVVGWGEIWCVGVGHKCRCRCWDERFIACTCFMLHVAHGCIAHGCRLHMVALHMVALHMVAG